MEQENKRELYQYAYKILLQEVINLLLLFAIGIIFECLSYMLLFMVAYIPVRRYAGGYHTEKPMSCTLLSAGMQLLVAILLKYLMIELLFLELFFVILIAEVIIWIYSPVEAVHKPLTQSQRIKYRQKSRRILLIEIAVLLLCVYYKLNKAVFVIGISHMFLAILMLIPQKKNR